MTISIEDFDRIKRLGSFAENLRADENFKDIIKGLKEDTIRNWKECTDLMGREGFWRDIQAIGRLEQCLKTLGETFRAEVTQLESEKKQAERMRRQREAAERG